jgi:hypothetical protein
VKPFEREKHVTCDEKECKENARWSPVLVLRSKNFPTASPHLGQLSMKLCDTHMLGFSIDRIYLDAVWDMLCHKFKRAGEDEPDRARVALKFKNLQTGVMT